MGTSELTLMNKNKPVCDIIYSTEGHFCKKITKIWDSKPAPPALIRQDGMMTSDTFNRWWDQRAVPTTRVGLGQLLVSVGVHEPKELLEANYGLSLSDRYWLSDGTKSWEDINYFDNPFHDFVLAEGRPMEDIPANTLAQIGPNSSLGGNMRKCWRIGKVGNRYLWKRSGASNGLDVYAEEIASALFALVFAPEEYVPYHTQEEDGQLYAICPNMLGKDEELVPAYDLIVNRPLYKNSFEGLLAVLKEIGVMGAESFLNRMFSCDFLIANSDRHYNNFGVIRNVETLEYIRMAPVFDSGNALWNQELSVHPERSNSYWAKPFGSRAGEDVMELMRELTNPGCLSDIDLSPFYRRTEEILTGSPYITKERVQSTLDAMHAQEERLQGLAMEKAVILETKDWKPEL